jgi:hypothetical protein
MIHLERSRLRNSPTRNAPTPKSRKIAPTGTRTIPRPGSLPQFQTAEEKAERHQKQRSHQATRCEGQTFFLTPGETMGAKREGDVHQGKERSVGVRESTSTGAWHYGCRGNSRI